MSEKKLAKSITLWAYTIGGWGKPEQARPLLDAFEAETGVHVDLEVLDYIAGDKRVSAVLGTDQAPDLVLEGPERLVADWGVSGFMEDLGDMMDHDDRMEIHPSVLASCTAPNGALYEYPLARTVHCMAINVDAFRAANALQNVNLKTHTWTTEQFRLSVAALRARYGDAVAAVYCDGQGGDQGTQALVTNLYDGPFTDPDHTRYTWDDPRIVKALEALRAMSGVYFDPYLSGSDEVKLFYKGELKMAFCWNVALQISPGHSSTGPGRNQKGEEIAFMAFPAPNGVPKLHPGVWGLGIPRRTDPERLAAAKAFVKYICDSPRTRDAVHLSGHFAVRSFVEGTSLFDVWENNPVMREYNAITPYIGDNYRVTPGWRRARTAWWKMLQRIAEGGEIKSLAARYTREANGLV